MPIPSRRRGQLEIHREYSAATRHVALPAQEFIYRQGVTGALLLVAAISALGWANSPWADVYFRLWDAKISFDLVGIVHLDKSLHHWINDGLMALFFFLVGMEIKGELTHGYLSSARKAALPVVAAVGGMVVPALIFVAFNSGTGAARGWGIPMATDIAFAIGVLALMPGIRHELKVFLLALAIVDDIGAILVIAFVYTETVHVLPLVIAVVVLAGIQALKTANVRFGFPYVLLGIAFWICVLKSGIHATLAGVILAFFVSNRRAISADAFEDRATTIMSEFRAALRDEDENRAELSLGAIEALARATDPPIERLTRDLHPWVGFIVLPLFALANSGVRLSASALQQAIGNPVLWGVVAGLVLGKPLGITLFSWVAGRIGIADIPPQTSWLELGGVGTLAGIGFTVAIFVSALAFPDEGTLNVAKTGVLAASAMAGILGSAILWLARSRNRGAAAA